MSEEFVSITRIGDLFKENDNQNTNMEENDKTKNMLEMDIEELDLTLRSYICLKRESIHTIKEIVNKTEKEIMQVKYMEQRCLEDIQYQLAKLGLALRPSDE